MPLGGNPKNDVFWDLVQEKILKQLDGWNRYQISRGGRLALCTSVLGSIPLYYLSIFELLVLIYFGVTTHGSLKRLVRWDIASLSRESGGLGVGSLLKKNKALVAKWVGDLAIGL